MTKLYYQPPSQEIFNKLKEQAIALWQTMDNEFGYVDEKVGKIKDIQNVGDNFMYMVAMFDDENQQKLAEMIDYETSDAIRVRMIDGGMPDYLIRF